MSSKAVLQDDLDLLPEQDVKQYIERLATAHQIAFERTQVDDWSEAVTRAAGDDVQLDGTEKLLVAVKKRRMITGQPSCPALVKLRQRTRTAERSQSGIARQSASVRFRQRMTTPLR